MTKRSAPSSSELTDAWIGYLRRSAPQGPLDPSQSVRVRSFWEALRQRIGKALVPPYGSLLESGSFAMVWDHGDHHFEIELLPDGTYDWFYMDRSSAARGGEEQQPLNVCSPEMVRVLALTLRE